MRPSKMLMACAAGVMLVWAPPRPSSSHYPTTTSNLPSGRVVVEGKAGAEEEVLVEAAAGRLSVRRAEGAAAPSDQEAAADDPWEIVAAEVAVRSAAVAGGATAGSRQRDATTAAGAATEAQGLAGARAASAGYALRKAGASVSGAPTAAIVRTGTRMVGSSRTAAARTDRGSRTVPALATDGISAGPGATMAGVTIASIYISMGDVTRGGRE